MLYVSSLDRKSGLYGVTDTDDGVTDYLSPQELIEVAKQLENSKPPIHIKGVKGTKIGVVSVTKQIAKEGFGRIREQVNQLVSNWGEDTCMEVARGAHFVKQIKGLPLPEMQKVTASYVYPKEIDEVVTSAQPYTNQVHEVNVTDKNAVINALQNNVCLVLQHKTNGVLTAFICTGSFEVEDSIYEPGFFETVYLTKQLYNYTYNINKVRPKVEKDDSKPKNPNLLNVMSCSLRFRNDGVRHDKGNMVLSSPFYTLNLERLFGMYILDNPSALGNTILGEFHRSQHLGTYDFDFDMWQDILKCCEDGTNYFGNHDNFMKYVNTDTLDHAVNVYDVIERFQSDFDYIEYLRGQGYSFNYKG